MSARSVRWNPASALAGVGLAVAAAAVAIYFASMGHRAHRLENELERERAKARFLASTDTEIVPLAGTADAPNAAAKLALDRRTGRAILFASGLPPPPDGRAYQLWFVASEAPIPGRTFTPSASGAGEWSEEIPSRARSAPSFAVTLEIATGTGSPSGPTVLKSREG